MKYLIVDLDDTLLKADKTVSEESINYINKIRKQGFLFVFNTARSYESAYPYIKLLCPDYSILNGGAVIYDINNNIVYSKVISALESNKIIDALLNDASVIDFSIQTKELLYSKNEEYCNRNPLATYYSFDKSLNKPTYKILISSENKEKWINMAKEYNLFYESYYDGRWFRISSSDKYQGNLALFNLLNDTNPKDYTFGDDSGDILMCKNAYHGVFLANAREDLKAQIPYITKCTANDDGIRLYMEELLK